MPLTNEELESSSRFIRAAISKRVLRPIDPKLFISEHPAITLACGDFTQEERYGHCKKVVADKLQSIELHGGGLLLDPLSLANRRHNHLPTIREQIRVGVEAKAVQGYRIRDLIPFYDWKCGVSTAHSMTAEGICRSAIHGKEYIKDRTHGMLPGNADEWRVRMLFYLHDLSVLGDQHPLVLEHPDAKALTFNFGREVMGEFLDAWADTAENFVSA